MKLLITYTLLLFPFITFSQTIINAEAIGNKADSLIVNLNASFSGTRGNSTTDQIKVSPGIFIKKPNNSFKLFGDYSVLNSGKTSLLHSGFVHIRHNFKLTNKLETFEFYQIQFNEVLLLKKREVYGGGLRFSFVENDSLQFGIGAGVMYENEFLNTEKLTTEPFYISHFLRGTMLMSFMWQPIANLSFQNITYFQPYFEHIDDYRLLNDFKLKTKVTKNLSFFVNATIRYDSKPPLILEAFDSSVTMGIGYSFCK